MARWTLCLAFYDWDTWWWSYRRGLCLVVVLGTRWFRQAVSVGFFMDTTDYLSTEIAKIEGLKILGKPDMSIISFLSISTDNKVNVYAIADVLEKEHGWKMERQQHPASIHLSVTPPHAETKEVFIADLKKSVRIPM
eukprot:TRINITY_DN4500_c1_g1_i8.p2 TRINITY_DN4500_c1_g1~~TRINITY_DN4500_c1_g1_i8.p2  ORF type:complete len:137 (-),score=39.10 TRINITY_DN4500_c1_g1_i8:244-654(-)